MAGLGETELYDFVTHPYWPQARQVVEKLIHDLERAAARAVTNHIYELGRLEGAERALLLLEKWRKDIAEELARNAANRG